MFEWKPGDDVRCARATLGLSQADVASHAGLTTKTVREVERSAGTVTSLLRVADALGHDVVAHGCRIPYQLGGCLAARSSLLTLE